jgi:ATP synthase F1 complex assembly factor 2
MILSTVWFPRLPHSRFSLFSFHQTEPEQLEALVTQRWQPILDWARETFDITLNVSSSVLAAPQPAATHATLGAVLDSMNPWELAAMERATYTSKSFIVALALVQRRLTAEEASLAAQVEVDSQIQRWGMVEDCKSLLNLPSIVCLQKLTSTFS